MFLEIVYFFKNVDWNYDVVFLKGIQGIWIVQQHISVEYKVLHVQPLQFELSGYDQANHAVGPRGV